MLARLFVTFAVFLYAVVVPVLEVNATHVFNPEWVAHARLHEVWQLSTNSALGLLCLWLVWVKGKVRAAAGLGLFVMGGFLFAFFFREAYGGSMVLSDGSEKRAAGLNLGVFAFGLGIALSLLAMALERRRASAAAGPSSRPEA
jgi:hypothetical protein